MNLAQNSLRAIRESDIKELAVRAHPAGSQVVVRFEDTGPGVAHPERLFRAFQSGFSGHGVGLYVSGATVKALGGDIAYEKTPKGASFAVRLAAVA